MSWSRRVRQPALAICLPAAAALLVSPSSMAEESSRSAPAVSEARTAVRAEPGGFRRSRCQRLRGNDRAPARLVKLVKRRNDENGSDLLGCVLPRGRVYKVAYSESGDSYGRSYRLRQVADAIVLVDTSFGNQYASEKVTLVRSLRSGRHYEIALACSPLFTGSCPGNTSAAAAFVNTRGQAAAAIVAEAGGTVSIVGFSPRGDRTQLDSGPADQLPPSSLRLAGDVVMWTHSGAPRSATLSGS